MCLEDKRLPVAYPMCRNFHTDVRTVPLDESKSQASGASSPLEYASSCIIPTTWTKFPLINVIPYNHDTSIFEFGLEEGQRLELPVCGCLLMMAPRCDHDGGDAVRPYTPCSPADMTGKFQILIKRYAPWGDKDVLHSYKPPGAVSNFVHSMKLGDAISFKHISANVKLPYVDPSGARGFKGVETITMIAVGVGLAPMIQALHAMLGNEDDSTRVVFLYGNRTVRDILLKEQLDAWEKQYPERFKVVHCIGTRYGKVHMHFDDCPKSCGKPCKRREVPRPESFDILAEDRREHSWVDEEVIAKHAFPPETTTRVFVCGLPSIYKTLCGERGKPLATGTALHNLGYTNDMVIKF